MELKDLILKPVPIEPGSNADITLFDPEGHSILKFDNIFSTSKNCAFINQELMGKVYGSFNNKNVNSYIIINKC